MHRFDRSRTGTECTLCSLARDVFVGLAIACVLHAAHRIASGVLLGARITALREVGEAYTPEEREVLIHKIKHDSLAR